VQSHQRHTSAICDVVDRDFVDLHSMPTPSWSIVERFQPEAFYAFGEDGQRTVLLVFDMADPSQIPVLTERMYQQGKAKIMLTRA
jgi:hypothetical protein